jgi:hypothetical protein
MPATQAPEFADRVLFAAETDIQSLKEAAERLLIMKKSLEREGAADAVAKLQKHIGPAFNALWSVQDVSVKIGQLHQRLTEEALSYRTSKGARS